jgi:hypothetical protein
MKTLLASALIATAALTGAASAQQVAPGAAGAIAHFNQDFDTRAEMRAVPAGDSVTVSTRSGVNGTAYEILNQSADTASELRGTEGATLVSGTPAFGAEIFERLAAESADQG